MRILHVASGLQKASGVTTFVENVVEEHRALGHEVDVLTKDNSPSSAYHLSLIDYHSYDIVHIHGLWDPWLLKIAKSIRCSPSSFTSQSRPRLVWSTHGMTAPWSMRHKWWKKCLVWWLWQKPLLRRAALIHSTVEQEAEWNRALGLVEKVKVKGVGEQWIRSIIVPLGTYLPEEKSESTAVHLCSSPSPTPKTLLFIGRIYPVKALDRLIEAFARAHVPGWQLRLVGPDQSGHTAELIALCEKLNIHYSEATKSTFRSDQIVDFATPTPSLYTSTRPTVVFAGPKFGPDLAAEYAACDILALVSHTENFGATVVDALAHGKPVITSTATPWQEVTGIDAKGSGDRAKEARYSAEAPEEVLPTPEACGWWVDNDVDTLTSCLRSALNTPPSTLAQMGARGRSLVESKYTWRAVASRLADAYASL